jgi:hypothetical protein
LRLLVGTYKKSQEEETAREEAAKLQAGPTPEQLRQAKEAKRLLREKVPCPFLILHLHYPQHVMSIHHPLAQERSLYLS